MKRTRELSLENQIKQKVNAKPKKVKKVKHELMISTGSTLLDLAISGGRQRGGGIPGGVMVVAYGPSGSGKTVLACEVAGAIQRGGGELKYRDSEARLDKAFSQIFGLDYEDIDLERPDVIPETFKPLFKWDVEDKNVINGYIVDSLAALSTNLEMDNDDGDKMGMRRAKEFSEALRKGARVLPAKNVILFCTNQIREKTDAQKFERKDINPGGKAIEFYSSLILRFANSKKLIKEVKVKGKNVKRCIGIEASVEVVKSSIWKPFHSAPLIIYFDYGIDDIRANLQYYKTFTGSSKYFAGNVELKVSLEESIAMVESEDLENKLKGAVTDLWEGIEDKFEVERKIKER